MSFRNRQSIRLKYFDYTSANFYFVTICTQDRECLFGVAPDVFVIMPNHIHGIVALNTNWIPIVGAGPRACPPQRNGQPQGVAPTTRLSLGDIVYRFKSLTTHKYVQGVLNHQWPSFNKRLWQRNYYEHIIRNEDDYHRISEYIVSNPENWLKDVDNVTCRNFQSEGRQGGENFINFKIK